MAAKITKVLLEVPQHGIKQDFEIDHAERILRMKNNGGWQLPENSKYVLTQHGLERRRNKKTNRGE